MPRRDLHRQKINPEKNVQRRIKKKIEKTLEERGREKAKVKRDSERHYRVGDRNEVSIPNWSNPTYDF